MANVTCSVCIHPRVKAINAALQSNRTVASVSRDFGLGPDSVRRHKVQNHYTRPIPIEEQEREHDADTSAKKPLSNIEVMLRLRDTAINEVLSARADGDRRGTAAALGRALECAKAVAEVDGDIRTGTTVNVTTVAASGDQATAIRILAALAPHPEAKAAVLRVLTAERLVIEGETGGDQDVP